MRTNPMLANTSGITVTGPELEVLLKAADPGFKAKAGTKPVMGWVAPDDIEGHKPRWAERFISIGDKVRWAVGSAPDFDLWLVFGDDNGINQSSYLGKAPKYNAMCGKTLTALSLATRVPYKGKLYDAQPLSADLENTQARPQNIQTFSRHIDALLRVAAAEEKLMFPELKVYEVDTSQLLTLHLDPPEALAIAIHALVAGGFPERFAMAVKRSTVEAEPGLADPVYTEGVYHGYYAPGATVKLVDPRAVSKALAAAGGNDAIVAAYENYGKFSRDWFKSHAPVARVNPRLTGPKRHSPLSMQVILDTGLEEDRPGSKGSSWPGATHFEARFAERTGLGSEETPAVRGAKIRRISQQIAQILNDTAPATIPLTEHGGTLRTLVPIPGWGCAFLWAHKHRLILRSWWPAGCEVGVKSAWPVEASKQIADLLAANQMNHLGGAEAISATHGPVDRVNPLVTWPHEQLSMKDVEPPLRVAYRKGAKEHFTKAYANIPEKIHVVRKGGSPSARDVYQRFPGQLILELPRSMRDVLGPSMKQETYEHIMSLPPNDTDHVTAFTPFTLFHRLGDRIAGITGIYGLPPVIGPSTKKAMEMFHGVAAVLKDSVPLAAKKGTYIVNTAAGRKNLLIDSYNIMADMFAKYMITGKMDVLNEEAMDLLEGPGMGEMVMAEIAPGLRAMRALAPFYY
jgi:hypothetical protein